MTGGKKSRRNKYYYSQTCPACGYDTGGPCDGATPRMRLGLMQKKFTCAHCGAHIDRRKYKNG